MKVLIVESNTHLSWIWQRHLDRLGMDVDAATDADHAIDMIGDTAYDVVIIDLVLQDGSALGVADYTKVRRPNASVIFVTDTTFFSDGSLFAISPNARALIQSSSSPDDIGAIVEHYGTRASGNSVHGI